MSRDGRSSIVGGASVSSRLPLGVVFVTALAVVCLAGLAFSGGALATEDPIDVVASGDLPTEEAPIEERAADPLANETGTTEVVVRFTPVNEPDAAGDAVVDELQDYADDEQAAFQTFAEGTDRVRIEREFWLANALLVSVDADETEAAELRSVANVTRVHDNVVVATHDGLTADRSHEQDGTDQVHEQDGTDQVHEQDGTDQVHEQIDADPAGGHTAGLELIDVPTVWDRFETRGGGSTVAVIDTGVDPAHQDIELTAWADFDENGTLVSDDVADATDPDGHGTHVAGTVAGGNASGTHIGVAPDATIHGLDAFGDDGAATFAGVLAAMEHATADEEVDVLQMSLGSTGTFRGFIAPVRNARAAGAVVVAAAGNEGENTSSAPANVHDALAVGAVRADENRTVASFSSGEPINATAAFGEVPDDWPERYVVPDVTAPGVGVVSAESGTTDGYVRRQGTSMAAPHVSGLAALAVAATDGRIDHGTLHASIIDTAVHPRGPAVAPDHRHGHGVVDGPAAVSAAVEAAPPPASEPAENGNGDAGSDAGSVEDDAIGLGPAPTVAALFVVLIGSVAVARSRSDRNVNRRDRPPGSL